MIYTLHMSSGAQLTAELSAPEFDVVKDALKNGQPFTITSTNGFTVVGAHITHIEESK